jgi:hypothetical protein
MEVHMKRVTGIGGIFFKAKDAPALTFKNGAARLFLGATQITSP